FHVVGTRWSRAALLEEWSTASQPLRAASEICASCFPRAEEGCIVRAAARELAPVWIRQAGILNALRRLVDRLRSHRGDRRPFWRRRRAARRARHRLIGEEWSSGRELARMADRG